MNYKLTNADLTTYEGCQWEIGVPKTASGKGDLCGDGWLHYYRDDPRVAVLMNQGGFDLETARLWEVQADGEQLHDGQLKSGCTKLTLIKEIPLPAMTISQRVAIAIHCALAIYSESSFVDWANNWLSGKDRSGAAEAAARAAEAAWAAEEAKDFNLITFINKGMEMK